MGKAYTKKAKQVMDEASKVSSIMHHNYIGTEHLLLGFLREGTGVAAKVLMESGVEEQRLIELIESLIAPSGDVLLLEPDGYSPRLSNVLEGAEAEAERFKSRDIGTEHLLIALIKETSILSYIALTELTKAGDYIRSRTYSAFTPYIISGLLYLLVTVILTKLIGRLERRLRNSER